MTTKFIHRFQRFAHRFRFLNSFYRPSNTGLSAGMETPQNNEGLIFLIFFCYLITQYTDSQLWRPS